MKEIPFEILEDGKADRLGGHNIDFYTLVRDYLCEEDRKLVLSKLDDELLLRMPQRSAVLISQEEQTKRNNIFDEIVRKIMVFIKESVIYVDYQREMYVIKESAQ